MTAATAARVGGWAGGCDLPIMPGMQATVEIRTGNKSVAQYLLKPLLKVQSEAFHER